MRKRFPAAVVVQGMNPYVCSHSSGDDVKRGLRRSMLRSSLLTPSDIEGEVVVMKRPAAVVARKREKMAIRVREEL